MCDRVAHALSLWHFHAQNVHAEIWERGTFSDLVERALGVHHWGDPFPKHVKDMPIAQSTHCFGQRPSVFFTWTRNMRSKGVPQIVHGSFWHGSVWHRESRLSYYQLLSKNKTRPKNHHFFLYQYYHIIILSHYRIFIY